MERKNGVSVEQSMPLAALKALAASWDDPTLSATEKERIVHLIRAAAAEQ